VALPSALVSRKRQLARRRGSGITLAFHRRHEEAKCDRTRRVLTASYRGIVATERIGVID
jgi:hypothetical protein